jgi:formylglycine-generating enzyme required for sulfatase activity
MRLNSMHAFACGFLLLSWLPVIDAQPADDGSPKPLIHYDGVDAQVDPTLIEGAGEPIPIQAMVRIPAGTFLMGSPALEKERFGNEIQHSVTLTRSFYMSRYEVTQREYVEVMGDTPGIDPDSGSHLPVRSVTWHGAMSYCARLTLSERSAGRLTVEWEYRLPTEAEWEYACRAGTTGPFHFGADLRATNANFNGRKEYVGGTGEVNNRGGVDLGGTTMVGSYPPNSYGLHEMHGNVWEWCLDWYGGYPSVNVIDPMGPTFGSRRVVRGGVWFAYAKYCRSAIRAASYPGETRFSVGFRPVLAQTVKP